MERTSICAACEYYGVSPVSTSVDPACQSSDEVDALCMAHRAKVTEGLCVLCGLREPWVSPWPNSDIGACELCFRVVFGAAEAEAVAHQLVWLRRRAA